MILILLVVSTKQDVNNRQRHEKTGCIVSQNEGDSAVFGNGIIISFDSKCESASAA